MRERPQPEAFTVGPVDHGEFGVMPSRTPDGHVMPTYMGGQEFASDATGLGVDSYRPTYPRVSRRRKAIAAVLAVLAPVGAVVAAAKAFPEDLPTVDAAVDGAGDWAAGEAADALEGVQARFGVSGHEDVDGPTTSVAAGETPREATYPPAEPATAQPFDFSVFGRGETEVDEPKLCVVSTGAETCDEGDMVLDTSAGEYPVQAVANSLYDGDQARAMVALRGAAETNPDVELFTDREGDEVLVLVGPDGRVYETDLVVRALAPQIAENLGLRGVQGEGDVGMIEESPAEATNVRDTEVSSDEAAGAEETTTLAGEDTVTIEAPETGDASGDESWTAASDSVDDIRTATDVIIDTLSQVGPELPADEFLARCDAINEGKLTVDDWCEQWAEASDSGHEEAEPDVAGVHISSPDEVDGSYIHVAAGEMPQSDFWRPTPVEASQNTEHANERLLRWVLPSAVFVLGGYAVHGLTFGFKPPRARGERSGSRR